MEETMVTIGKQEYGTLLHESVELSVLKNCLWNMAELNYSRDDLRFDGIEVVMKMLFPDEYKEKFERLKENEDNE